MKIILMILLFVVALPASAEVPDRLFDLENAPIIAAARDDADCSQAYQLATKGIVDKLPADASAKDAQWAVEVEHRLEAVHYGDTGWCGVYDIRDLEQFNPHRNPHEVYKEYLDEIALQGKMIITRHKNQFGQWYTKVDDCPLCM